MDKNSSHFSRHATAYLLLVLITGSVALSFAAPMHFRLDDAHYLEWAAGHDSILDAFVPEDAELFGTYRPMQNLAWWTLYKSFGLQPMDYQLALTLLYALSIVLFFHWVRRALGSFTALLAVLGYGAVFYTLGHIVFWFSDLTFVLELLFIQASLLCMVLAYQKRAAWLIPGLVFYLAAAMSKEPAALIVPLAAFFLAASDKNAEDSAKRKRALFISLALLVAGVVWILFSPALADRQGINDAGDLSGLYTFAHARWTFYAKHLFGGSGILLLLASIYAALRAIIGKRGPLEGRGIPLFVGGAVAAYLYFQPTFAMAALFACAFVLIVTRHKASAGAVWMVLCLLGLFTVKFITPTYLVEASWGAALLMGVCFADLLSPLAKYRDRLLSAVVLVPVILLLAGGGWLAYPKIKTEARTIQIVSGTRLAHGSLTEYLIEKLNAPDTTLVVVEYADMGLDYQRDISPLARKEKAQKQKTMEARHLEAYLHVAGKGNIRVVSLRDYIVNPQGDEKYLVAMNRYEADLLRGLSIKKKMDTTIIRGEASVTLYRLE